MAVAGANAIPATNSVNPSRRPRRTGSLSHAVPAIGENWAVLGRRRGACRLRGEQRVEPAREQVGVSGPASRHVTPVLNDERWLIVVGSPALGRARTPLELSRIVQGFLDLVLDVGGIGPVVAPDLPRCRKERRALHELR